jgi:NAD(P)-dependent dehydrogenase (short-subunit alcohol dehydrogenase family)
MDESFAGRVALVTGAASGIGRASALAFARAGATVVLADTHVDGGQETARLIAEMDGTALFVPTDVTDAAAVEQLVARTIETYGRLDYAHNNAGILGELAPTADCTEENWGHVLAVNLTGVWLCLRAEIRWMAAHGGGAIVNTASIDGMVASRNRPAYVASKHGVAGLTKAAALEYARAGIRVNAVCPGAIRTPMRLQVTGGDPVRETQVDAWHPIGRQGEPEEVAAAVVWLCSAAASFVTGHLLTIDGGVTAF